jgi:hypothetical protein
MLVDIQAYLARIGLSVREEEKSASIKILVRSFVRSLRSRLDVHEALLLSAASRGAHSSAGRNKSYVFAYKRPFNITTLDLPPPTAHLRAR